VKAIEFIIVNLLKKLDKHIEITENIDDHDFFCKLDDNIINLCKWIPMKDVQILLEKLERRDVPKMIIENKEPIESITQIDNIENIKNIDIREYSFKQEIIITLNGQLDCHPINKIFFYNNNNRDYSYHIKPEDVSIFNNKNLGQKITRFYI
jgi:hypothetical protein